MAKTQRLLDPIHNLIVFWEKDATDQVAWQLINTREFQRLRRICQLGFSEIVFPGATHTRFSHCIGVFHTARMLLAVIKRKLGGDFDQHRAQIAAWAALLHDLGHGPFSHTFEGVEKRCGRKKRHEEWTAELIRGDTDVRQVLAGVSDHPNLADDIAELLTQQEPMDIYAAVVSSQFDADRLDYLRRDRYMAGVGSGGFDSAWLLDCLEVGTIIVGVGEDEDTEKVPGLYLNHKGLEAAEGYLLARYHLYAQVYTHKTTRGAEQMLGAALAIVAQKIVKGDLGGTGLPANDCLVRYFSNPTLENYLALDDSVIWAAIENLSGASHPDVARLSRGLRDRRLYKCFDIGARADLAGGNAQERFRYRLQSPVDGLIEDSTLLTDRVKISAYGFYGFEERQAHQKVLIGDQGNSPNPEDIARRSRLVSAIPEKHLYRVYVPDADGIGKIKGIWEEVTR
jgi:uncharacterized protein